jgi:hypothetical protein
MCLIVLVLAVTANGTVADFENLTLGDDSHWSGTYPYDSENDTSETVSFGSGDASFSNTSGYSWGYSFWNSWAYSNETDSTTPGFGNQYSAYVTDGAGHAYTGDNQYGVYSKPSSGDVSATISFDEATISGMWVTNTTYAYLSMRDGDSFTTMFGATYEDGESGPELVNMDDPDWFKLTITGSNSNTVDFFLADYSFADNSQDYIVDEWAWIDLSGLGDVTSLELSFTSTDNGGFGMNNPGYFAMDNFNGSALDAPPVPEPTTIALLGLGGLLLRRRRA